MRGRLVLLLLLLAPKMLAQGGGGVPGLVNGTCDDACRQYLAGLTTFESVPAVPERWFTCTTPTYLPPGNDAGPCSNLEPCIDLELAEGFMNQGYHVRLDHCEWDGADELATWDGMQLFTTGFGSGGADKEDCVAGILTPARPELLGWDDRPRWNLSGNAIVDGDNASSAAISVSGTGSCPHAIAGLWIDHYPQNPGDGIGETMIVMRNAPGLANSGDQGHVELLNIRWSNVVGQNVFAVRTYENDATAVVVLGDGLGGGSFRDTADFDSDCAGPTCAGNDPVPQAACTDGVANQPYPNCDGGTPAQFQGRGVHFVNGGEDFLVLGDGTLEMLQTQHPVSGAGPGCGATSGFDDDRDTDLLVMGAGSPFVCRYTNEPVTLGLPSVVNAWGGNPARTSQLRLYQTLSIGPDITANESGCWRMGSNAGIAEDSSVEVFQSTCTRFHQAIELQGQFSSDTLGFSEDCNQIDDLHAVNGGALVIRGNSVSIGPVTVTTGDQTVYDCDDGGAPVECFRFRGQFYDDVAAIDFSDPASDGSPWIFTGNTLFGGSEGGATPLQESGGDDVDGHSIPCRGGAPCDAVCNAAPFLVPFPKDAFLGSIFVGEKITHGLVGTHYDRVGAQLPRTVPAAETAGLALLAGLLAGFALLAIARKGYLSADPRKRQR